MPGVTWVQARLASGGLDIIDECRRPCSFADPIETILLDEPATTTGNHEPSDAQQATDERKPNHHDECSEPERNSANPGHSPEGAKSIGIG